MRTGWELKPLKEVGKIVSGATPKSKVAEYWDGGISWITPKDLGTLGGQKYILETSRKITELGLSSCSAQLMPKGSVIMSSRAPIGHLGIATNDICTNQGCKSIVPNEVMNSEYIYYYLLNSKEALNKLGTGAVFPELSGKMFGDFLIPVPPLKEQQQIVEKLDQAFEFIDQAKANIEQNIINAKELFQSKLDEVFSQKGDGWITEKLKNIGNVQTGNTPNTKDKENYGDYIEFIKPGHFTKGGNLVCKDSFLSEKGKKIARIISPNSVLMVCIGATIGKLGYSTREVCCNQQINTITPYDNVDYLYLYYFLSNTNFIAQIHSLGKSSQATLPIINKSKWENLEISYPKDMKIQKALSERFKKLYRESEDLHNIYQQKLGNLEELRKSILEKAFRGELTN
ncbi:restriction endonuclease subunit S [Faecalibacter bovis]|uniref:Restriction endonuclease subunit S n=1 Tax=Faecalibacter bovis TaxID=2898187 RepID=A0ABX7XAC9_9FLAO|nr:restriction endonuclease subunit S [Faecalibacter bovis]QTV04848.1 restriction endonuclease subunit S [Faecalibacter bovis]